MSILTIALLVAASPADSAAVAPNSADSEAPPVVERPFHEINDDLRALMRRESAAKTDAERADAVHNLAELYLELRQDPRLPNSDTLKSYKAKLWSRLTRIKARIEKQMSREERNARDANQQQRAAASLAADSLASQLALLEGSLGGPAGLFGHRAVSYGGGAGPPDHGQALVELIERVIAPDKWQSVGGPFSIYYYRPLRVLVVSATAEVHHKIGGALGGLRGP